MKKNLLVVAIVAALVLSLALAGMLAACGNDSNQNNSQRPVDPTEPTSPTEPTNPSTPTTPTEPSESTNPTNPTNPTEPSEPSEPPFVPSTYLVDPALEIYSQRAHIGYEKSVQNVRASRGEYANGEPAFVIPGLNEGENFVLQGVAYCEEHDWTLLAGYISPKTDNINSVVFVIDMTQYVKASDDVYLKGALIKEILLDEPNGDPYTGHAGGIAVSEKTVWISNGGKLYYFALDDVVSAPSSSHIALANSIDVPVNASYTAYADGVLWVGEFEYKRDDYITDDSHHRGSDLTAWTVGYYLDESGAAGYEPATGFKSSSLKVVDDKQVAVPDVVLWHGEKVQGMTTAGGDGTNVKVVLSTSYGRKNTSALYLYDVPLKSSGDETVDVYGAQVPCHILKNATTIPAPPMLEDVAYVKEGEKNYILLASESGSYKYYGAETSKAFHPTDLVWKLEIK